MKIPREGADLLVVHRTRQTVGAKQVNVGDPHVQRALEIHLDVGLGPQTAGDDVLGDGEIGLLGCQVIAPHQLPDQAMIEGELIDPPVANPVDPGIADVRHQSPFGQEQERGAGRPHSLKIAIGRRPAMNQEADLTEGLDDGL